MKDAKAAHSEDWSHLGKPDTGAAVANTGRGLWRGIRSLFRRAVRYERAVWSALAAGGLPSPVVAVLKWGVRLGLGGYLLFKSLPMLTVGLAYALKFALQYGLGIMGVVGVLYIVSHMKLRTGRAKIDKENGFRNGDEGYGYYYSNVRTDYRGCDLKED